jgi:hypothetical protein
MFTGGKGCRSLKTGILIMSYLVVNIIIAISFFIIILIDYKDEADSTTYDYASIAGSIVIIGGIGALLGVYNGMVAKERIILSVQTYDKRQEDESRRAASDVVATPPASVGYGW